MNAAALTRIDDGKTRRVEQVPSNNDIRPAKQDKTIAIGMSRRLMEGLNALPVKGHFVKLGGVGLRRPLCRITRGHARQHIVVRQHARRVLVAKYVLAERWDPDYASPHRQARPGPSAAAADMVGVDTGIN